MDQRFILHLHVRIQMKYNHVANSEVAGQMLRNKSRREYLVNMMILLHLAAPVNTASWISKLIDRSHHTVHEHGRIMYSLVYHVPYYHLIHLFTF
jgi:hypothetical protein